MVSSQMLGRSLPCVLGKTGSYCVQVETLKKDAEAVFCFRWRHGRRVRDSLGREVMRAVIHVGRTQVLLRDPHMIMDMITNQPFSIFPIEKISLVVLGFNGGAMSVEVISIEEFVVLPPFHDVREDEE